MQVSSGSVCDLQNKRGTFCVHVCVFARGRRESLSGSVCLVVYVPQRRTLQLWFSQAGCEAESLRVVTPHTRLQVATVSTTDIQHPRRITARHTHGTGCTLSAAITACMARGMDLDTAVFTAKNFITKALVSTTVHSIGQGVGPVDHMWAMDDELSHLK